MLSLQPSTKLPQPPFAFPDGAGAPRIISSTSGNRQLYVDRYGIQHSGLDV
jgi:hypothetical protein